LSPDPFSPELQPLRAKGDRVRVSTVVAQDIAAYRRAVDQSRPRLIRWNPVDSDDLDRQLPRQSRDHRTFLVHALQPEGDHGIVGKINVTNVVRGRLESAAIGYDAYDPYAGRGLFAEGIRLVLDLAFRQENAGGMGLHRIEAAVQPGNVRSAGLLRSLGFRREGFSPRMLWLPGADGNHAWQDHVSYVVLRDEWPSLPYPPPRGRRVVALVNGPPGSFRTTLARQLAAELGIPLYSEDIVKEGVADALWALLEDSPVGGVVDGWFRAEDAELVAGGLQRCGVDPATVTEIWCWTAQQRTTAQLGASARPMGLGPTVTVDTGKDVNRAEIVRIALQIGA